MEGQYCRYKEPLTVVNLNLFESLSVRCAAGLCFIQCEIILGGVGEKFLYMPSSLPNGDNIVEGVSVFGVHAWCGLLYATSVRLLLYQTSKTACMFTVFMELLLHFI